MSKDAIKAMKESFSMTKQRCYNPNQKDYKHYGGRGITICSRWLESFDNFLADMGERPEGMTLERVDNDGPYSPENCRWATRKQQGQNTRLSKIITYRGEFHTVSEWERILGWKQGTLKARLGPLKYTVDQAFSKPVKSGLLLKDRDYPKVDERIYKQLGVSTKGTDPILSPLQVAKARELHKVVAMSYSMVAVLFKVSIETASNAVQGLNAYSRSCYA